MNQNLNYNKEKEQRNGKERGKMKIVIDTDKNRVLYQNTNYMEVNGRKIPISVIQFVGEIDGVENGTENESDTQN